MAIVIATYDLLIVLLRHSLVWPSNSWNKCQFLWFTRSSVPPPPHLHVHFGSTQSVGSVGLWDLLSSELLVVRATETQPYGPITRRDESCEELQEQGVDSHWDRWCLQPFHVWYFTYHNTFRSVKDSVWYTWSSSAKYLLRQLMFPSWWHENLMRW